MRARLLVGLPLLVAFALAAQPACDGRLPSVDAGPPDALPLAGTYRVSGTTVDALTGEERAVSGTIVLKTDGASYTSSFSLNTVLPGVGEPQSAELVGHGQGTIDGRTLDGSAETQLIVALVPGVDVGFGMLPRVATARILNRSHATVAPDGSVEVAIESDPAPGSDYAPSRTTLRGERMADVALRRE